MEAFTTNERIKDTSALKYQAGDQPVANFLGVMPIETFRANYLSKCFLYVQGQPDKFKDVFGWLDLNRVLEQHRLNYPRLRIVKNGDESDPGVYLKKVLQKDGDVFYRPLVSAIAQSLDSGSTLVLDSLHEMSPRVEQLCNLVEQLVHEQVQANLYVCLASDTYGFDVHWDDHDVIIVQVEGQKKWSVFEGNGYKDSQGQEKGVAGELIWQEVLQKGDILYLPKGTWHLAEPQGETLHLTLGFTNRTGTDVLKWFHSQMAKKAFLLEDFPKFAEGPDMHRWQQDFKCLLSEALSQSDVQAYRQTLRQDGKGNYKFNLPFILSAGNIPHKLLEESVLEWLPLRQRQDLEEHNGDVIVTSSLHKVHFSPAATPLLNIFSEQATLPFKDFVHKASALGYTEPESTDFCISLLKQGVINIVS